MGSTVYLAFRNYLPLEIIFMVSINIGSPLVVNLIGNCFNLFVYFNAIELTKILLCAVFANMHTQTGSL